MVSISKMIMRHAILSPSALILAVGLGACAHSNDPPSNINNACTILEEREDWYDAARSTTKKWNVPTAVILAIIWRESSFRADAQTQRTYALGFIPWGRQSSAYGFAQAIDSTWEWYQKDTKNSGAERNDFTDAADFIGWYMTKSFKRLGISLNDPMTQYLAYHQGHSGYKSGRWRNKKWLIKASRQVARKASLYDAQLRRCDDDYARERALAISPVPKTRPFALAKVPGVTPTRKPMRPKPEAVPASTRKLPGSTAKHPPKETGTPKRPDGA